jgi:succinate dehydrogenase/fumarate reductase flavoprotein subunit
MAATMGRLAKADPLLAMVVATRESVPIEVQQQLAASGDATILERLAANPQTDGVVLGRIAGTNAATAASVARHPNAPPDALASLAASADPAVRMALLEHPKVPVATLSRLAADMDADVRKRWPRRGIYAVCRRTISRA